MPSSYPELFQTLDRYLRAVDQKASAEVLLPLIQELDGWEVRLEPTVPPMLRHYLQRKSYRKAWLYLQDRDAENTAGSCGH